MNNHHRLWYTPAAAALLMQLGITQNCRFALLRSSFQAVPPTLFFIYQERATQLVLCHTLTDTRSRTIHNHCGQLPSCFHLTISVWCSLCGISGCFGKQNFGGGWLVILQHVFSAYFICRHFDNSLFFSSYSIFCCAFNVALVCICTRVVHHA